MPESATLTDRDDQLAGRLLAAGRIEESALDRARRVAGSSGEGLPEVLLKLGLLGERDLARTLAEVHDCPLLGPDDFPAAPLYADKLSPRFLREARVLPVAEGEGTLHLAMADPGAGFAREAMALLAESPVTPCVAVPAELEQAIERLYAASEPAADAVADTLESSVEDDVARLRDMASEAPVIRLVNRLIQQAIEQRASDIHLEPFENRLRLRYRVDGVLREADAPALSMHAAVVSRIKIMARLDIAERRLPQDGRIKMAVRGSQVDLRISTIPTLHGESVVMRILDQDSVRLDFDALGVTGPARETLEELLARPNGILLVTGPTGSGKTTTLYTALKRLNADDRKILTVEDPIEYQLEGINQIQVKPSIGLDFAACLRAILRQDPDIILIGEIRDLETAQIAAQAALTGHLVLSTLHTNNAASTITRLLDMGVEEYLVTATVNGVAAQRLVRRLCPDCAEPYAVEPELAERLNLASVGGGPGSTLYKPVGCKRCNDTGYRGRASILETLTLDDALRRAVLRGTDASQLHRDAVASGLRTLYHDGLAKALAGTTSVDEVLRATRDT
ncbi:type II secretion system protein E (GspE) [Limimonas halophila]|uniref:Type II secretion system protein E n=1 Tax=Limimonas halophila TaxID=1082479 RepID=A0A1G7UUN1_9PROT|nr:type II secretion system ATPase GspE [Limimonas halophila]SDG51204.1 type II secretion system protein E (GspE) [Limimonas halophila]